jgi:hypothetical protein
VRRDEVLADQVAFELNGGDFFDENVSSSIGVTITSYGSGQPTICGASGSPTLTFSNCGGITLDNLRAGF